MAALNAIRERRLSLRRIIGATNFTSGSVPPESTTPESSVPSFAQFCQAVWSDTLGAHADQLLTDSDTDEGGELSRIIQDRQYRDRFVCRCRVQLPRSTPHYDVANSCSRTL